MRVAGYVRVSTEEQTHGYSLDAQRELIRQYAAQHGDHLVEIYADEGKSASKALNRRKELLRMVADAEAGKFDYFVFKDLTRWSRNPAAYYEIQKRLDACGVFWRAIEQEGLETQTTDGKFMIGLHLSLSARESAVTGDRIRFVNSMRVKEGGALQGSQPLGYTVGERNGMKVVVIDEDKRQLVNEIFDLFDEGHSVHEIVRTLRPQGKAVNQRSVQAMIQNPLYKGLYRGIENYCEPYLTPERWERMQQRLTHRAYTPKSGNVYLFGSLCRCAECGHPMYASSVKASPKDKDYRYNYYQCGQYQKYRLCTHNKGTREDVIETYLLENVEDALAAFAVDVDYHMQQRRRFDAAPIRAQINRLKDLYVIGDLTLDEYKAKKELLEKELAKYELSDAEKALERVKSSLSSGWRDLYAQASKEARRAAWSAILHHLEIDNAGHIRIFFI